MKYKGIIFDMDGVISDTQKLHSQAESDILAQYGVSLTPAEISRRYSGVKTSEFMADLLKGQKDTVDMAALMENKRAQMNKLASGGIDPIPGIFELLAYLKNCHMKIGLASASGRGFIDLVLDHLNIRSYFDAITSAEEVSQGKPAPDIFLLAAKKLELQPGDCIVIEDGISGMTAAKKAGMKSVGLVPKDTDIEYPADVIINSLDEFPALLV